MREELDSYDLFAYLGPDVATALSRWAADTGHRLVVPADRWRRGGYTGAFLAPLFVTDPNGRTRLVIVKCLLPEQSIEPKRHGKALAEAPDSFRGHLVEQPYPPLRLPSNGSVMFQALAGNSVHWKPLADLPAELVRSTVEVLTHSLTTEWNPTTRPEPRFLATQFQQEINEAGSVTEHLIRLGGPHPPAWWRTAEDSPLPNPLLLPTNRLPLADRKIDLIVGRAHSDLHAHNVLVDHGQHPAPESFVLVDLMTYTATAPLSRDLVTLVLSVAAGLVTKLTDEQRWRLLAQFVQPTRQPDERVPLLLPNILRTMYETAARRFADYGSHTWHRQYLFSLSATALAFTTYTNLGGVARWWFLRLAGYAGRELIRELDPDHHAPSDAPILENPFTATEPAKPPAPAETVTHLGAVKIEFTRRLGDSWRELADYLDIPEHDQRRFTPGYEAQAIWTWLEIRRTLGKLVPALVRIERHDLAHVLRPFLGPTS